MKHLFHVTSGGDDTVNDNGVDLSCDATLSDTLRHCRTLAIEHTGLEPAVVEIKDGKRTKYVKQVRLALDDSGARPITVISLVVE